MTTSLDGYLKFWKKTADGIEFVKQYRSHMGRFSSHLISSLYPYPDQKRASLTDSH
jgi:peptidylprolyl isomerase domain and WD repeat-containing protein 1